MMRQHARRDHLPAACSASRPNTAPFASLPRRERQAHRLRHRQL